MRVEQLDTGVDQLGESPVWDAAAACLFWIDSRRFTIFRYVPATREVTAWQAPRQIGSIGLATKGLVVALEDGFYRMRLSDGKFDPIARLEPPNDKLRLNDGKVDRSGRHFIAGTMSKVEDPPTLGSLYSIGEDGAPRELESGIVVSNALCFSPDGRTMYHADSMSGEIRAYDYDGLSGKASNRRVAVSNTVLGTLPDGATVDSAGRLWVALVLEGKIGCYSPQGTLISKIDAPAPNPSCLAFGGANMDILFMTSISDPGGYLPVSQHPGSGHVFALHDLGATGIPEQRFLY